MSPDVVHVPEQSRFEVAASPEPAVLIYEKGEGEVALLHTIVPVQMEGQGVGTRLVEAAIGWAQTERLQIVPICSFVQDWLTRNPDALRG